jgi:hypothetical protein
MPQSIREFQVYRLQGVFIAESNTFYQFLANNRIKHALIESPLDIASSSPLDERADGATRFITGQAEFVDRLRIWHAASLSESIRLRNRLGVR